MLLNRMRQASISQESTTSAGRQSTTVTSPRESVKPSATTQAPTQTTKPMLGQTGRGASILGLLAAKRFTRNMKNKYGRTGSIYGSSRYSTQINIQKEPSYRMEPTKKFNADEAFNALKSVVDKRMEGFRYHPKFCSNMTKMLSDEIKNEVKKLKFDRYKIVAVVHISEKRGQSMMVASRCAWDKNVDEFATYTMETPTLFCSASVFGIYNE